ncbi:iron chaperone [Olivibacter sp. XZL3]|uniref:iron chaperone n=1 Tax=Olivibacter sp. XZL3 TaxID=1735116 RepID=UPI001066C56F|nr:DUF1801 domain-containing protein [Olivibacter sp. XZL3]
MKPNAKPSNIDEYINAAPENAQQQLKEIRKILKEVAPNASEELKWGHPTFVENRILFSYAAFKNHLNFVPTAPAMQPFLKELANYKTNKDSIQFRYDEPLAIDLIKKIAEYRLSDLKENDAKWKY